MFRADEKPNSEPTGWGFTLSEMANFGERPVLRNIVLVNNFARLVFFLGHGSYCLNNPHKSAYDCGACSGGDGGPNARALAAMLNEPRVRAMLARRGIAIPSDTIFLGGLHNTCSDKVTFFDLHQLPLSHREDFETALDNLHETCQRNAHERCRRFQSAPLNVSMPKPTATWENALGRFSTNATRIRQCNECSDVIRPAQAFRGFYLDRRCFLHSYDPTIDDDQVTILGRILVAVVPVCSGINLQYNFSSIDNPGWGSGTKLPHNVTSLLGVMDGHASDLRTGLPVQG